MINFESKEIRKRFCKDCGIPINIFVFPYFESRLSLYDGVYGSRCSWNRFIENCREIGYTDDQDFFNKYDELKNSAIEFIKSTSAYERFNNSDCYKEWNIPDALRKYPSKDIYKSTNDKRYFISIDMVKANFTALSLFDPSMFDFSHCYEDFIRRFTSDEHFINSKYIRQVIFGNCNPGRQVSYEKFLMSGILAKIIDSKPDDYTIEYFSNDEIVIGISDLKSAATYVAVLTEICMDLRIDTRIEVFRLRKLSVGIEGYIKEKISILNCDNIQITGDIDIKGVSSIYMPFVLRFINGEVIRECDRVFMYEGMLAKLIDNIPDINLSPMPLFDM